jgi:hypothetical protein
VSEFPWNIERILARISGSHHGFQSQFIIQSNYFIKSTHSVHKRNRPELLKSVAFADCVALMSLRKHRGEKKAVAGVE